VNLRGSQALGANIVADGNAYYRNSDIDTLSVTPDLLPDPIRALQP